VSVTWWRISIKSITVKGAELVSRYQKQDEYEISSRIEWWRIVDLPEVVKYGNARFADGKLAFFATLEEALGDGAPDAILCSHTLQCLVDPYGTRSYTRTAGAERGNERN
jgi:hypothetical protein